VPLAGATVTVAGTMFFVSPADSDVNATLYLRWIADYPSTTGGADDLQTTPIPPSGQPVRPMISFTFDCTQVTSDGTQWSIAAVLSNEPFEMNNTNDLTANTMHSPVAIRTWTLIQTCMRSQ
jgi:hypothetical protein